MEKIFSTIDNDKTVRVSIDGVKIEATVLTLFKIMRSHIFILSQCFTELDKLRKQEIKPCGIAMIVHNVKVEIDLI